MDFGAFCELEPGLTTLLHATVNKLDQKKSICKKII